MTSFQRDLITGAPLFTHRCVGRFLSIHPILSSEKQGRDQRSDDAKQGDVRADDRDRTRIPEIDRRHS